MAAREDSLEIDEEDGGIIEAQEASDEEEYFDLDADDDDVVMGCNRLFLLPFEPLWYYSMLFIAIFQVYLSIFEAGFRKYGRKTGLGISFTAYKYFSSMMYTVDILLLLGYKNIQGIQVSPAEIHHPNWVLLADFISILPLEFLLPMNPITPFKAKFYYVIQLNRCLKAVRVYHTFYHAHNSVGTSKWLLQMFQCNICLGLALMVSFVLIYWMACFEINCPDIPTQEQYSKYLYIAVSKITARGMVEYPSNLSLKFAVSIIGYVAFIGIICESIAYVTIAVYTSLYHQYGYLHKLKLVHIAFETHSIPKSLKNTCIEFFDFFWKNRHGYTVSEENFMALAESMNEEITLDITWYALKHSKLLRNMDVPFLRHVSVHVQSEFLLPGQVIYNKNYTKNMMIYVVSGVIEVLSNEDDDTPILLFSAGTCLGESSLILNYKPKTIVRCKTFCVLHVLEAKKFVKLMKHFPEHFHKLREDFKERIISARTNQKFAKSLKHNHGIIERTDYVTIMWLKNTLHRLMVKDGNTSQRHQCQNIFLRDELDNTKFIDRNFTAKNLDMLVISERLELIADTVFLKTSCPCVFQPVSVVLNAWEGLIIIFAIVNAFLVPYFALVEPSTPLWYDVWVIIITILWIIDLYVQLSTATKKGEEIIVDIIRIFLIKIGTLRFLLDLFASIPLEYLASIIIEKISPQYYAFLGLNRVLKIWRVNKIFKEREEKLDTNLIINSYCKYCCILFFTAYICACITFSVNCFDYECIYKKTSRSNLVQFLWCAEMVTHILTGTNIRSRLYDKTMYHNFFLCVTFISTIFFVFIYASLAAEYALQRVKQSKVTGIYSDIISTVKNRGLSDQYYKRIFAYVETQWMENFAARLLYKASPFTELPPHIYTLFKEIIYRDKILSVPLFHELPDRVIIDICAGANFVTLPPNEVICYTGDISYSFYIIANGYCKIIPDRPGEKESILETGDSISTLEACLHVPVVYTVVTITHCKLVSLPYDKLQAIYFKYPEHKEEVEEALEGISVENTLEKPSKRKSFRGVMMEEKTKKESFRKFSYNIETDSFEEYDYYIPFDRLGFLSFVQYFLLRWTILPESKFLYRWEISRCVCAVLSALFFSFRGIGTCVNCDWYFFLALLDGMAWIDIYLRLHICYYNENGILVTHPLSTALYYLQHGFLIDFLGVFPVHLFFPANSRHYNEVLSLLQLNRLFQMHRYMGFFNYIETRTFVPSRAIIIAKYFPILLILCICIGSALINAICEFKEDNFETSVFTKGVKCLPNSWIAKSNFKKPMGRTRVQAYAIYFATTMVTLSGMHGFEIRSTIIAVYAIPLAFFAYILNIHVISKAISHYTGGSSTLLEYQASLNVLSSFMKYFKVRIDLQRKLLAYFDLKWHRKRGRHVHATISRFTRPLQQDILYDIYGNIAEVSVFTADSTLFLRNLFLEVFHEVAPNESYILTVNDITKNLYILYKGKVSVLAPDGSKMATLTPGSMFGNLDDCDMMRQTVSILALGHVEMLIVQTYRYHAVLKNYPQLHKQFKQLIALHVDYIQSTKHVEIEEEDISFSHSRSSKNPLTIIRETVFLPNSTCMKIWRAIVLVGVCYFDVGFGVYQTATSEYTIGFIIMQYTCDTLYIINYYVQTHTAYENEFGMVVTNLKMIKKRFLQDRVIFWCCLLGMVPLDVFAFFFPTQTFRILFPILRVNRLLRFVYFIYIFKHKRQKLSTNLQVMRITYIISWSTFILHFCTCIIVLLSCTHTPSMSPAINCNKTSMSSYDRFKNYITYSYLTISCFTRASQNSTYPESILMIIVCIFLMIFFQLLSATFIAQIYSIIRKRYYKQNNYARNVEKLRDFMEREQVSDSLFTKAYEYLRFLWRKRRGASFPQLLLEAPPRLREPILNSAFGHHINNHFIFEKCHVDFNRQVVACLRNETYFKDDYIVFQGSTRRSMYFIHSGEVAVITEDSSFSEIVIELLKPGKSFGVTQGLFPKKPYSFTFRANKTTVILCLKLEMWEHLFRFFPASKAMISTRYIEFRDKYA